MREKDRRRRDYLAVMMADRLAAAYNRSVHDAARVAEACDEAGDRSGNLLGWLREYARLVKDQEADRDR